MINQSHHIFIKHLIIKIIHLNNLPNFNFMDFNLFIIPLK